MEDRGGTNIRPRKERKRNHLLAFLSPKSNNFLLSSSRNSLAFCMRTLQSKTTWSSVQIAQNYPPKLLLLAGKHAGLGTISPSILVCCWFWDIGVFCTEPFSWGCDTTDSELPTRTRETRLLNVTCRFWFPFSGFLAASSGSTAFVVAIVDNASAVLLSIEIFGWIYTTSFLNIGIDMNVLFTRDVRIGMGRSAMFCCKGTERVELAEELPNSDSLCDWSVASPVSLAPSVPSMSLGFLGCLDILFWRVWRLRMTWDCFGVKEGLRYDGMMRFIRGELVLGWITSGSIDDLPGLNAC